MQRYLNITAAAAAATTINSLSSPAAFAAAFAAAAATTVSSPSLDNIRLGFRHIITALSICLATIPDGFNDNFVVFTHDDIQFNCQGVSENNFLGKNFVFLWLQIRIK